jgi:hypothetical protein
MCKLQIDGMVAVKAYRTKYYTALGYFANENRYFHLLLFRPQECSDITFRHSVGAVAILALTPRGFLIYCTIAKSVSIDSVSGLLFAIVA